MRPNHSKVFAAAIMAAMASTSAIGATITKDSSVIPIHKAPAVQKKGEAANVERLLCAPIRLRGGKLWPYRGKNKTQRARLSGAFQSI